MRLFSFASHRLVKAVAVIAAISVPFVAYSAGTAQAVHEAAGAIAHVLNAKAPQYSAKPVAAYKGRQSRSTTRGSLWSSPVLKDVRRANEFERLYASVQSAELTHTLSIEAQPGGSLPWEGSAPSSGGSVNTGNGNKLTKLHLFDFASRGGTTVDFTLFHNSQTTYEDELGYGWTWTYDIYINNLTGNPVVHWGDGLAVPFAAPGGDGGGFFGLQQELVAGPPTTSPLTPTSYAPPAGIYDQLVKNDDSTWTLTTKAKSVYQFNAAGFCTSVTDRNGNAITFTLNAGNYVTKITAPDGRYVTVNLDGSNHFTSVVDPSGRTWSFTRNGSNDLTTVTWPTLAGSTYTDSFAYSSHRVTTHTDRAAKAWTSAYNSDGSIASETDPLAHSTTYGYSGGATTVTDPLGHTSIDNYSGGLLASRVDGAGFAVSYTARDVNHNVTSLTDQRGKVWTSTYDASGNTLTQTDPLSHTKTFTYNGFSEVLTATDALGHTTTNTYDTHGNLLTSTDPLSHVKTFTYDTYGQVLTAKDGLNHTTTTAYTTQGYPSSVTDATSRVTSFTYGALGQVLTVTDPSSHTETVDYDAWLRPVKATHPDSSYATTAYDAVGRTVSKTDELGHTSTWVYDDAGRLTSFTNPRGDAESYGYDAADRRTSVTNGRGKTRTYTFTNRGEVTSLTMPDGAVEQWTYDGAGHTTAYTDPVGYSIGYVFDDAGRQTTVDYPTGTDTVFTYDAADRRTQMVDSTGTTSWAYDNANRVTTFTPQSGTAQTWGYDAADRRTSVSDAGSNLTTAYDDAGRVTSVANGFSETTAYTYDSAGRLSRKTFSSGQYEDYGYDSRSRLTSVVLKNSGGTALQSHAYTYDAASRLTSEVLDGATTSYGYDNADQLVAESRTGYVVGYTYDANGNRLTKVLNGTTESYTYDDGDKLLSAGSKTYTYDAAGRTKTVTTGGVTTTLWYDYEGRLGAMVTGSTTVFQAGYNGLDTRAWKIEGGAGTGFVRAGAGVTDPVLRDAGANYTPGISERRSGVTTFLHSGLKDATAQSSTSQVLTASRVYDAFGMVVSSTGTWKGPFGYAGEAGYQEDSSGLQLLGHRYYDPSTGRFLTRDPAKDGRNWYSYSRNSPTIRKDRSGLQSEEGDEEEEEEEGRSDIDLQISGIRFIYEDGIKCGQDIARWFADNLQDAIPGGRSGSTGGTGSNGNGNTGIYVYSNGSMRNVAFEEIRNYGGVYAYPDANGGYYVGQSGNLGDRLNYWGRNERIGGDVVVYPILSGTSLTREIFEQGAINGMGGVDSPLLTNIRNPIGPNRAEHLTNVW